MSISSELSAAAAYYFDGKGRPVKPGVASAIYPEPWSSEPMPCKVDCAPNEPTPCLLSQIARQATGLTSPEPRHSEEKLGQIAEFVRRNESAVKRFPSGAVRSADADHVRYDLIPPAPLRRLAIRYAVGAKKYGDDNYLKGMPTGEMLNHLQRHIELWKLGDETDDHLAAAAWGLFALMQYEAMKPSLIERKFAQ